MDFNNLQLSVHTNDNKNIGNGHYNNLVPMNELYGQQRCLDLPPNYQSPLVLLPQFKNRMT